MSERISEYILCATRPLSADAKNYKGTRYKILDDLLDGIFCAYLAYYFWYCGERKDAGC